MIFIITTISQSSSSMKMRKFVEVDMISDDVHLHLSTFPIFKLLSSSLCSNTLCQLPPWAVPQSIKNLLWSS